MPQRVIKSNSGRGELGGRTPKVVTRSLNMVPLYSLPEYPNAKWPGVACYSEIYNVSPVLCVRSSGLKANAGSRSPGLRASSPFCQQYRRPGTC